ncbi:MAG: PQQ-dependent sugar dehydrogenase [Actinomycetota bacterium]|nr:PQQ-dependent sugar dehydrogenase [Actinomycetota bacterium]
MWERRRLSGATGALMVTVALVAGACGSGDDAPGDTSAQPSVTVPAPSTTALPASPEAEPATASLEELDGLSVRLTEVASLDAPVAMAERPGHDPFFVAERAGRVMVVDGGQVRPEPLLEVDTTTDGERGLLGIVFSPDGTRLYVSYTNLDGDSRLEEYAMGEGAADIDLASKRTLLAVAQPFSNHNGGHVVFGPDDLLYYGLGDGGGGGDPDGNAQNTSTLLGAVLRIDPRDQGEAPYAIPADNPFAGGGGRGEVFLYGVRNPWRFSFDRATGDLWLADVGQNAIEEINRLTPETAPGANLGWPALEGTRPYDGDPPSGAVAPVYEYTHDEGFSVTGGYVYRGQAIPALQGAYLFGDLGTAQVWALAVDASGAVAGRADLGVGVDEGTLVSFFEDAAGELYVISIGGTISRLDPA